MKPVLRHAALALAINLLSVGAYHLWLAPRAPVIGIVDAWRVYKEEEGRHLQALAGGGGEAAQARALEAARRFSANFPAQLAGLERECACLVLERSALAAVPADVLDLTPLLRQRVRP